jgi:NADH-quinone oxidoreductase subunit N
MDMKLVLSINGVLILVVGLFPDFWMKLALSLFISIYGNEMKETST